MSAQSVVDRFIDLYLEDHGRVPSKDELDAYIRECWAAITAERPAAEGEES